MKKWLMTLCITVVALGSVMAWTAGNFNSTAGLRGADCNTGFTFGKWPFCDDFNTFTGADGDRIGDGKKRAVAADKGDQVFNGKKMTETVTAFPDEKALRNDSRHDDDNAICIPAYLSVHALGGACVFFSGPEFVF